jgi:hypothetical protein
MKHTLFFFKPYTLLDILFLSSLLVLTPSYGWGKKSSSNKKEKSPKTQEVNFDEISLNGQVRNPQGAYLVQKNGLQFMPLYDIQKNIDSKIRRSQEWAR